MKQSIIAPTILLLMTLSSCNTASHLFWGKPKTDLPPETSDKEIIQLAQQAFNSNNYKLSDYYYNVLLQRYGNNTVDYIIGKFEIAHIAVRLKDYDTAVPLLREIIQIYDDAPTGELPAAYRVLAQNDLKSIPEKDRISVDAANGGGNDYYEDGDYGDTDFFGSFGGYDDGSSSSGNDDDYYDDDDYYEDQGNYSPGFHW